MIKSKRADSSMIKFLIGLILLLMAVFTFAQIIKSCVKGPDRSAETFKELAEAIEHQSLNNQGDLKSTYIHIGEDEIYLFFNKGENYTLLFPGDLDLELNTSLFGNINNPVVYFYDRLPDKKNFDWPEKKQILVNRDLKVWGTPEFEVYAFEKPSACGNSACMVLCSHDNLNAGLYNPKQLIFSDYNADLSNVYLVKCSNPKQLKTFEKVNYFFRYPFYTAKTSYYNKHPEKADNKDYFNAVTWPGTLLISRFFCPDKGASDANPIKSVEKTGFWSGGIGKCDSAIEPEGPISVSEYKDGKWLHTSLIGYQYIYTEILDNNVVFCYQPPCISPKDELYIKWKSALDSCLLFSDCDVLNSITESYVKKNQKPLVFDSLSEFEIIMDEHSFGFEKDIWIWVVSGDKEQGMITNNIKLEYDPDAANNIKLEANNKDYSFIGLRADNTDNKKPVLKFMARPYTAEN